jgi:hypothetical protein
MAILWLASDNIVRLTSLRELAEGGGYVASATVTAQIQDSQGTPVGSSIALTYVPGSNGDYEGVAADDLALVEQDAYTITVVADDGPGRKRTWILGAVALYDRPS